MTKASSETGNSIDDIVRRAAGERPMAAARAARRRDSATQRGAAEAPGDVTTDASPEAVAARTALLSRRRGELSVPGVSADRLRELSAQSDENLGHVAPATGELCAAFPLLSQLAGVTKESLEADTRRWAEMGKLRGTAAQLRQNVQDTRRLVGGETRDDLRATADWVRAQLQPGARPRDQQNRLRSATLEFMAAWERVEAEPQAERDKTRAEAEAHREALSAEDARAEVLRTVLTLQEGGPADQAEWDRAAARYDELVAADRDTNRRLRAR